MSKISQEERVVAYKAAIALARETIGDERGFISPNARVGSLSDSEWDKIASACVSGWICERSKQLTVERFEDESFFLATGEVPEPTELGLCSACLRPLGDLVEGLGLSNKSIGEWSKQQILLFVWTAAGLVAEARVKRDERPGPVDSAELLMAAG